MCLSIFLHFEMYLSSCQEDEVKDLLRGRASWTSICSSAVLQDTLLGKVCMLAC